jgi:hypothetical protein
MAIGGGDLFIWNALGLMLIRMQTALLSPSIPIFVYGSAGPSYYTPPLTSRGQNIQIVFRSLTHPLFLASPLLNWRKMDRLSYIQETFQWDPILLWINFLFLEFLLGLVSLLLLLRRFTLGSVNSPELPEHPKQLTWVTWAPWAAYMSRPEHPEQDWPYRHVFWLLAF